MALPVKVRNESSAQDNPFGNRCTARLSDGSVMVAVYSHTDNAYYIYRTTDFVTFSLKITLGVTSSVFSMAVEDTGDHMQFVAQYPDSTSLYWARYTKSGSTWSQSGTNETITNTSGDTVQSCDIDTLAAAGACVVTFKKIRTNIEKIICKVRGTAGTWSAEVTAYSGTNSAAIAYDPVFCCADTEGIVSSKQRVFFGGQANYNGAGGSSNKFYTSTATFHTGTGAYQSDKVDNTWHHPDLNWQSFGIFNHATAFRGPVHGWYLVQSRYYNALMTAITVTYVQWNGTLLVNTFHVQRNIPQAWGSGVKVAFSMVTTGSTFGKLIAYTYTGGGNVKATVYDWNLRTWTVTFLFSSPMFLVFTRILAGATVADDDTVNVLMLDSTGDTWHEYNQPCGAPTARVPADGATVDTDTPVLGGKPGTVQVVAVSGSGDISFIRKLRADIADNSGFSSAHKTEIEPDDKLDYTASHSFVLSDANQLDQSLKYYKMSTVDAFGKKGTETSVSQFTVSHPPSATNLDPKGGKAIAYGIGYVTLSWVFNDSSPVDERTAYQIEVRANDDGSLIADTAKVTSSDVSVPVYIGGGEDIDLKWRVKLWDRDDVAGEFSDYEIFKAGEAPTVSIDAPTEGATVATAMPLIQWTYSGVRVQQSYRVVVVLTASASTIIHDSGWKNSDHDSYRIPEDLLVNHTDYTITVSVRDTWKLQQDAVVDITTTWTPPDNPLFFYQDRLDDLGYVLITWSNSHEDADFISYKVMRRLHDPLQADDENWEVLDRVTVAQPTYEYDDWTARSATYYDYTVIQIADRFGEPTPGDFDGSILDEVTLGSHYWLIYMADKTLSVRLDQVTADSLQEDFEEAELLLQERGRKHEFGTRWGYSGSLTAQVRDNESRTAREARLALDALKAMKADVMFRNPFGDLFTASMGTAQIARTAGVGQQEMHDLTLGYSEVS